MAEKIPSRNSLFRGELIDKPPRCVTIYDLMDEAIYTCPHCKKQCDDNETDVMGAEPGCRFCPFCNREFEI